MYFKLPNYKIFISRLPLHLLPIKSNLYIKLTLPYNPGCTFNSIFLYSFLFLILSSCSLAMAAK